VEFVLHNSQTTGKSQYLFSVKGTGLGVCALRVTGASVIPESQLVDAAAELTRRDYSRLYLTELANGTLRTMYQQRGYWRAEFRDPIATLGTAPDACAGVSVTLRVDEGAPYMWDHAEWRGGVGVRATHGETAPVRRALPPCRLNADAIDDGAQARRRDTPAGGGRDGRGGSAVSSGRAHHYRLERPGGRRASQEVD